MAPPPVAPEDRIPPTEKVAYGLGTVNDMWGNWLYPTMVWPVFNIFLHVSPSLVSTALLVNRLVDAVSDPFFGWISDNTRSRWGRRRPYILVGSILAGLSLPMLFMVQPGWSEQAYFWYMVISSGVFITIVSCFNMPYVSLGNELTPSYQERTSLFSYKGTIQKLPEIGLFFAAAFMTLKIFNDSSGEPDILQGARVYTMILGAIMILVGIIIFCVVKERYYERLVVKQTERTKLVESIWQCLKVQPFRAQLAMSLAYGLSTSMLGSLGYYLTVFYVCEGDVALGSKWNFFMGLGNLGIGVLGVLFFNRVAHRLGKRAAMFAVQFIGIGVFLASWFLYNPEIKWLQLFAAGSISFIAGGFWMLYGALGADVIDYDELQSHKRREGAFAACGTWIMKLGLALGIGMSGFALESTGFDAELGAEQLPGALTGIRIWFMAVPIGGLIVAMIGLWRFPLTPERMAEIRAQLEARRGTV
jgi:glycoside/pentoside/hexuronide:cation symporter, GPH family